MKQPDPIPYGKQWITSADIEAVVSVLRSDFLTQGPAVATFEQKFAQYIGARYAIAVANGTVALHLCTLALGVNQHSRVITTPITFAASANCVRYCGGEVEFADIDPQTYLLDINLVEAKIRSKPAGYYQGLIPVDFAGAPVNMELFRALANKHNLWLIEDACHAPGGYFIDSTGKRQQCGNGQFADLAIFSFHPVKHIATGEGGMITTNDQTLYEKILLLRTHGITRNPDLLTENHGGWYYEMHQLGYNYRLSDIQAALGSSQLDRAAEGLERRKAIADAYDSAFATIPFIQTAPLFEGHAHHLYVIQTENRKELYSYLRDNNVYAQIHYIPVHLMPYYQQFGWQKGDFRVSEQYYERCLSLPIYPSLQPDEQQYVIELIRKFYSSFN